jgi:hypothetical protein
MLLEVFMKTRHAAALALLGWWAIFPPLVGGRCQLNAPVSQWDKNGPYDTADQCKSSMVIDRLPSAIAKTANGDAEKIRRIKAERCVATDDPRLKETK